MRATAQGLTYNVGRGLGALAPFAIGTLALSRGIGPALALTSAFFLAGAVLVGLLFAGSLSLLSGYAARRAPSWGCGGELGARTEYTATAFSKPLMLIFRAVYRPTREVETVGEAHFPSEVRYRAEIEPTFERFLYGPLTRGVLGVAERMKVIQAGSLHAYLAYVIVLVLSLVLVLWWRG